MQLRIISRVGHVAHKREIRNEYKILVRKPEEKRPFSKSMCKWIDNIKMEHKV
jgi:hypothetical protein